MRALLILTVIALLLCCLAVAYSQQDNGEELNVYLNGELDGTIPVSGDINENAGTPVWIGKKANEAIFLDGVLDELAIFNIGLNEAQLRSYMESGLSLAVEPSFNLAISWAEIKSQ